MTDLESMALCAVRYCLGRRSYIVSSGHAWARRYGAQSRHLRQIIIRDISEARDRDDRLGGHSGALGDPHDKAGWLAVLAELEALEAAACAPAS